jgi:hypothetical protein
MDEIKKLKDIRKDYRFIYYVVTLVVLILVGPIPTGTFAIWFSWGTAFYLLFMGLVKLIFNLMPPHEILTIIIPMILTFVFLLLFTISYTMSLSWLNQKLTRLVSWRFPYLTIAYHLSGAAIAYFLGPGKGDENTYMYFIYVGITVWVLLFIFIDWRLARKVNQLEKQEVKNSG